MALQMVTEETTVLVSKLITLVAHARLRSSTCTTSNVSSIAQSLTLESETIMAIDV